MKKLTGLYLVIACGLTNITYAKSLEDFKKNLISSVHSQKGLSYKKLNFNALDGDEKDAINTAIEYYSPHFAFCGSRTFYKHNAWDPVYEINDYKGLISYRRYSLEKSDILNGILWKGFIGISFNSGVARPVLRDGSFGEWIEMKDLNPRGINLPAMTTETEFKPNPKSISYIDGMWSLPDTKNFNKLECTNLLKN